MSAGVTVTTNNGLVLQNLRTLVDAKRLADNLPPIPGYAKIKRLVGGLATTALCQIHRTPSLTNPSYSLAANEPGPLYEKCDNVRIEETWLLSGTDGSNAVLNIELEW